MLPKPFYLILDKIKKVLLHVIGGKMTFPLGSLYHGTKFAVEGIGVT
jgi:hypothetical protein